MSGRDSNMLRNRARRFVGRGFSRDIKARHLTGLQPLRNRFRTSLATNKKGTGICACPCENSDCARSYAFAVVAAASASSRPARLMRAALPFRSRR